MERTFFETSQSTTFSSVRGLLTPLAAENGSSVSLTTWSTCNQTHRERNSQGGREEREGGVGINGSKCTHNVSYVATNIHFGFPVPHTHTLVERNLMTSREVFPIHYYQVLPLPATTTHLSISGPDSGREGNNLLEEGDLHTTLSLITTTISTPD